MKVVILCAGYATRLYPITLDQPKALLEYKGKKILDYLIEDLNHPLIHEIILVSNHKYYSLFSDYSKGKNIRVIDDGSTCSENRLGAGNDLLLGIKDIDEDTLVMACDNLLDFSLSCFIDFFYEDRRSSIMFYKECDEEKLKQTGQVILLKDQVIGFKEKPKTVVSVYAVPPFYIFNRKDINEIKKLKGHYESLGNILEEVVGVIQMKAYPMNGNRLDLGSSKVCKSNS